VGYEAADAVTTGARNVAMGHSALGGTTTGADNTAIGDDALLANTTGNKNTTLGSSAGSTITTGANLICIGYNAEPSSPTATDEVTIGDGNVATARVQVDWTILSDGRDKNEVTALKRGLDFVRALLPVTFEWSPRIGKGLKGKRQTGFIAQDVLALEEQFGVRDKWQLVNDSDPDRLEWTPSKLVPVLVRALQELADEVETLKEKLNA